MAKVSLLVVVSEYRSGFAPLPSAAMDIEAVRRVLENPKIGSFDEVRVLLNPDPMAMQEAVETLFSGRKKDDLALLFFSGHGVKDDRGRLYFATRATRKNARGELVKATAVPALFVQDIMRDSRCKRQVVILDCCFSGAFAEGMTAKDSGGVDIQTQLGGEGRAVLTSSTSTQYSFEQQGSALSIYTQYLVEGLETGQADLDSDGAVSVDELHDYVRQRVEASTSAMKPKIYVAEEGFRIRLARAQASDPNVAYRRQVERLVDPAGQVEISPTGRRILEDKRRELGLSRAAADAIEEIALEPYRAYQRAARQYEQAYAEAYQRQSTISPVTRKELNLYRHSLGISKEDALKIEAKVEVDSAARRKQHTQERRQAKPIPNRGGSQTADVSGEQSRAQYEQQSQQQSQAQPKKQSTFSLIQLLLTTIVIGILSAIALPSFINQANRARQSEAKTYLGSINRGQQAYFLENNQFAENLAGLGLGIEAETERYRYDIRTDNSATNPHAISTAIAKEPALRSYVGGAFVSLDATDRLSVIILCESLELAASSLAPPQLVGSEPQCGEDSVEVN